TCRFQDDRALLPGPGEAAKEAVEWRGRLHGWLRLARPARPAEPDRVTTVRLGTASRHSRPRLRYKSAVADQKLEPRQEAESQSMAGEATTRAGASGAPAQARGRTETGLSIVVPLFNEAGNLAALHGRIIEVARALKAARGLATEVVYVDDG